jgi:hypothetical protein
MPAGLAAIVVMMSLLACSASVAAPTHHAAETRPNVHAPHAVAEQCRPSPFADLPRTNVGSQSRLELSGSQNSDLPGFAMTVTEESGSLVSATTVVLRAQNGEPDTQVNFETPLDRMVTVHPVPNELLGKSQSERRLAVLDGAFALICAKPDPSLERLLERGQPLHWYSGSPELPTNYALQADASGTRAKEWVEYLGANHRRRDVSNDANEMQLLHKIGELELRASAHGAVIVDVHAKRYAWIYVYPGGSKLRFPSVRSGTIEAGRVVLNLNEPELDHEETAVGVELATGAVTLLR